MEGDETEAPSLPQPPPSEPDQVSDGDAGGGVDGAASTDETLHPKPTSPSPTPSEEKSLSPDPDLSSSEPSSVKEQTPPSQPPMLSTAVQAANGHGSCDEPDVTPQNPPAEPNSPDGKDPSPAETTSSPPPTRSSPVLAPKFANGTKPQSEDPDDPRETLPEEHSSDQEKDAYALQLFDDDDDESEEEEAEAEAEARRLMSLAQENYRSSDLKSALKHTKRAHRLCPGLKGLAQMLAALRVLRAPPTDHYRVLRVEPFSHYTSIRAQYRALALLLHPDKSQPGPFWTSACEEAFKRISEALRVLSDRKARKDYDLRLRMELQRSRENGKGSTGAKTTPVDDGDGDGDSFSTTCDHCRLSQQFALRYAGHQLVCSGCGKSFLAVETEPDRPDDEEAGLTNNMHSPGSVPSPSPPTKAKAKTGVRTETHPPPPVATTKSRSGSRRRVPGNTWASKTNGKRKAPTPSPPPSPTSSLEASPPPAKRRPQKEPTLADMQREALRLSKAKRIRPSPEKKGKEKKKESKEVIVVIPDHQLETLAADIDPRPVAMAVEDSDFYDFDKDRVEKSFRKGQVWAIYDDDGGMPRHYGLIDEVLSTNPFMLKMCWLDLQSDKSSLLWEQETGCHISCGRFKVTRKVEVDSVNMFSHVVDCNRIAKEMYRIYPKKGSVWALYSESTISRGQERRYDIVVSLTSCTDLHGVSVGYLEKVEGFKTLFKRREIGPYAVKWMKKGDSTMFSHQIPARKLSGKEAPDLPEECWELDPASLPAELLSTTWMG